MKFNGVRANEEGGCGDLSTTRVFRRREGDDGAGGEDADIWGNRNEVDGNGKPILVRSRLGGLSQGGDDSKEVGALPYSIKELESKGGVAMQVSDSMGGGD